MILDEITLHNFGLLCGFADHHADPPVASQTHYSDWRFEWRRQDNLP